MDALPPNEERFAELERTRLLVECLTARLVQIDPGFAPMVIALLDAAPPYPDQQQALSDPAKSLRIRERAHQLVREYIEALAKAPQ